MKKQLKCYIYTRVSTTMQVDDYSLDARKDKLHKYADYHLLKGLVYCGDCGTNLVRNKNVRENRHTDPKFHVWYNYICPVHTTDLTQCSFLSIPERTLLEAVNAAIKVQMITAMDMEKS